MNKNFEKLLDILEKKINEFPAVEIVSENKPFFVLISSLLSTRTKDEVTEEVSKRFFKRVRTIDDLLNLNEKEIEKLIYPVGFYKTKAKVLKRLAKILKEKYNGKVPNSLEELLKLPGVGRKVANLVLIIGFKKEGIAVDTHVHRISNRWEVVNTENEIETEYELRKMLPKKYWFSINKLLVVFGKEICNVKPKCTFCFKEIKKICPYYKKLTLLEKLLSKYAFRKCSLSLKTLGKEKGTYILKIRLKQGKKIEIGGRKLFFKKGFYFYVGSAFGKSIYLKSRIKRHLSKNKKMFWHIDFLLAQKEVKIEEIFISNKKCECKVAKDFSKFLLSIENFGSSDCKCKSHLFFMKF